MSYSTLSALEKQISSILSDQSQETARIQDKKEAAAATMSAAAEAMKKAQETGDTSGYANAANEYRTAKDIVQMHIDQLKKVIEAPALTAEQYSEIKAGIYKAMDAIEKEAVKDLVKALAPIQKNYDELTPAIDLANKLLSQVQRDLFKQPVDIVKEIGGQRSTLRTLDDRYRVPDIYFAYKGILNTGLYKKLNGGK